MTLLSSSAIAQARRVALLALPDTAVIKRPSGTRDAMGGRPDTETTIATVACRVDPVKSLGSGIREISGQQASDATWTITLPVDTSIQPEDHITVGSRRFKAEVVGNRESWELTRRVACTELT